MEESIQETGKRKKMVQKTKCYFDVLEIINAKPVTASEIAKKLNLAASTVYKILKNLEQWDKIQKKGLVYYRSGFNVEKEKVREEIGRFKEVIKKTRFDKYGGSKWVISFSDYEKICKKLKKNPFLKEEVMFPFFAAAKELGYSIAADFDFQREWAQR